MPGSPGILGEKGAEGDEGRRGVPGDIGEKGIQVSVYFELSLYNAIALHLRNVTSMCQEN